MASTEDRSAIFGGWSPRSSTTSTARSPVSSPLSAAAPTPTSRYYGVNIPGRATLTIRGGVRGDAQTADCPINSGIERSKYITLWRARRGIPAAGFNVHQFIISPIEGHSKNGRGREKNRGLMGDVPRVGILAARRPPAGTCGERVLEPTAGLQDICPQGKEAKKCPM